MNHNLTIPKTLALLPLPFSLLSSSRYTNLLYFSLISFVSQRSLHATFTYFAGTFQSPLIAAHTRAVWLWRAVLCMISLKNVAHVWLVLFVQYICMFSNKDIVTVSKIMNYFGFAHSI